MQWDRVKWFWYYCYQLKISKLIWHSKEKQLYLDKCITIHQVSLLLFLNMLILLHENLNTIPRQTNYLPWEAYYFLWKAYYLPWHADYHTQDYLSHQAYYLSWKAYCVPWHAYYLPLHTYNLPRHASYLPSQAYFIDKLIIPLNIPILPPCTTDRILVGGETTPRPILCLFSIWTSNEFSNIWKDILCTFFSADTNHFSS